MILTVGFFFFELLQPFRGGNQYQIRRIKESPESHLKIGTTKFQTVSEEPPFSRKISTKDEISIPSTAVPLPPPRPHHHPPHPVDMPFRPPPPFFTGPPPLPPQLPPPIENNGSAQMQTFDGVQHGEAPPIMTLPPDLPAQPVYFIAPPYPLLLFLFLLPLNYLQPHWKNWNRMCRAVQTYKPYRRPSCRVTPTSRLFQLKLMFKYQSCTLSSTPFTP